MDQYDRPLYGDVFGVEVDDPTARGLMEQPTVDTEYRFGSMRAEVVEMESDDEVESDDEEKEGGEEEEEDHRDAEEAVPAAPSALEAVDTLELRKKAEKVINAMGVQDGKDEPKSVVKVLEQKQTAVGDGLYGSSFQYVIPGGKEGGAVIKSQKTGEEVITLDTADLEDIEGGDAGELLKRKFEAALEAKDAPKGQTFLIFFPLGFFFHCVFG